MSHNMTNQDIDNYDNKAVLNCNVTDTVCNKWVFSGTNSPSHDFYFFGAGMNYNGLSV